ncbi:MAG: hypothetical protein ACTHJM_07860 [Marmoricola sp.]
MVILGTASLTSVATPSAGAATPAVVVPASTCTQFDPNLGRGACLRYQSRSGTAYTWIGTYRAPNGSSFFCIDYLYDSRISAASVRVPTTGLRNQLGRSVGAQEVAALNAMISARAPGGSAASAEGNAAIALIIREVMSDGIRNDGTVVYPPGLKVHGTVGPVVGGMPNAILTLAQQWWAEASQRRGPWTVRLDPQSASSTLPLGQSAAYSLRVTSADARTLSGVSVTFTCTGPITCPGSVTTSTSPSVLRVTPRALGAYTIMAKATGPSAQGQLLKGPWASHGGTTATNNGVQRGWIVQGVSAGASARGAAEIVKATPSVVTQAQPTARPGDSLTDLVTVSGLPAGYDHPMSATLYGPFDSAPTAASCTPDKVAGTVTVPLRANGSVRTPAVAASSVGYYVWTESLPGDDLTNPVVTPCGVAEETTLVKAAPRIATVAVGRPKDAGAALRDRITVTDAAKVAQLISWRLLGPVQPTRGGCSGVAWEGAPVAASGQLATTGDGEYVTPERSVTRAGCYTYVENLAASAMSSAAETAPGEPSETVLIVDWPKLKTVASAQRIKVPGSIFDTIRVTGVTSGEIDIEWSLLGPLAPGARGCSGLNWRAAPVRSSGRVSSANGSVRTPSVRLNVAGCYTFREHSVATVTAAEADSPPGLPEETVLAIRPSMRVVPEVPTGAAVERGPGWWMYLTRLWVA